MKKLAIVATLLLATTSAYAGNAISFEVNGHKIRIEAPRNCDSLSCLQISGISGSGFGSKSNRFDDSNYDDDNNVTSNSDQPVTKSQPAPAVQTAAPVAKPLRKLLRPRHLLWLLPRPRPHPSMLPWLRPLWLPTPLRPQPETMSRQPPSHRQRRSASGAPRETRGAFASSRAATICAAMPSIAAKRS